MVELRLPQIGEPEPGARSGSGAPWLAMGYRPFFLAAALHACLFIPLWLLRLDQAPAPALGVWLPAWWHAHEMLCGFTLAVIAGFLLTAVRNWTGRDTASGPALAALLLLWVAGRAAMLAQGALHPFLLFAATLAFPLGLLWAVGRPLVAARSRQNYGILALLGGFTACLAGAHAFGLAGDASALRRSLLTGVHLVVLLNVVIGGRVIPTFTWVAVHGPALRAPAWVDRLAIAGSAALVPAVAFGLDGAPLAVLAAAAGAANLLRLVAWTTPRAWTLPLVLVLHVGYTWIGVGQLLLAAAYAGLPLAESTALHALTVGVIGTMTLGMMIRVALGHGGRPLEAPRAARIALVLMFGAPLARLSALLLPARFWTGTVQATGLLFALAFALYLVAFARILTRPRPDGQPG